MSPPIASHALLRWIPVTEGLPVCDGETVFIGVNEAGFSACFNAMNPDGLCLMGTAEASTAQMSCLKYWRVLDRPGAAPVVAPAEPQEWHDEKPDLWTAEIEAAHPMRSGAHKEYGTALEMVGNRRSKGALVELVCWLLQRRSQGIEQPARAQLAPIGADLPPDDALCAARYRWLRQQDWFDSDLCVLRDPKKVLTRGVGLGADCPSRDRLDTAIDAARGVQEIDRG